MSFHVDSRNAFADGAQHFIGYCSDLLRDIERADGVMLGLADQDDLVPNRDTRDVGDIKQGPVHTDVSGDAPPPVADEGLPAIGEGAVQAVRIAHRHRRDPRRTPRVEGGAVAEWRAAGNVFQVNDARLESEYRLEGRQLASMFAPGKNIVDANT